MDKVIVIICAGTTAEANVYLREYGIDRRPILSFMDTPLFSEIIVTPDTFEERLNQIPADNDTVRIIEISSFKLSTEQRQIYTDLLKKRFPDAIYTAGARHPMSVQPTDHLDDELWSTYE